MCYSLIGVFMLPEKFRGAYSRRFVRPSVILSFRHSVTLSLPVHNSKTVQWIVMLLHGWIDLLKGEGSAQEPELYLSQFLSYCPLLNLYPFSLPVHNSKTVQWIVMPLHGWIDLIKGKCSA